MDLPMDGRTIDEVREIRKESQFQESALYELNDSTGDEWEWYTSGLREYLGVITLDNSAQLLTRVLVHHDDVPDRPVSKCDVEVASAVYFDDNSRYPSDFGARALDQGSWFEVTQLAPHFDTYRRRAEAILEEQDE